MYCNKGFPFSLNSRFIRTPDSVLDNLYPSEFNFSANFPLRAASELLSPYSALYIIITIPFSFPNYVTASVQSFSLHLHLRYTLFISHANIYKLFKDTGRNKILVLSMDTTLEYVIGYGGDVVCPSATNLAFLVNFPSILMSNIMCTLMFSYPVLIFTLIISYGVTPSIFSNVIRMFAFFCNLLGPKCSRRFPVNIIFLFSWDV